MKGRFMNDSEAAATVEAATGSQSHPAWCDLAECTMCDLGGAHHSAWMTLGPLPDTDLVVRAYLYTTDESRPPATMVSFHYGVVHPDDVAKNAGLYEDTISLLLPSDQVEQLKGFLTMLEAMSAGVMR